MPGSQTGPPLCNAPPLRAAVVHPQGCAGPRPGQGCIISTRPQELWKQPHLLSLHISPPRNMSRLYHRAPKLAMACCGCPCARRPLIHPCLAAGTPELSTRPRNTTVRCVCASARAQALHAARAQHAAAPRPGRRAHADSKPPPRGQPASHRRTIICMAPWAARATRPPPPRTLRPDPRSNTPRGARGRARGDAQGFPRPPDALPTTARSLDRLNQRTRARAAARQLIPHVRPRPSCRRRRRRPRAAGPHPGPAAASATTLGI